MKLHWFLPTTGDSRTLVGGGHSVPTDLVARGGRRCDTAGRLPRAGPRLPRRTSPARQSDLGFESVLTPTGTPCEDAWVVASALIAHTTRLKFLVAARPGLMAPTLLAQMSSTFQRVSGDRLALNVVVGGDPSEQLRFGDRVAKDDRYARAEEFLAVFRGAFTESGYDFAGDYYDVEDASTRKPATVPPIYLGGSSAAAGPVTARQIDVYLTWGEPPAQVAEKIAWIRKLAEEEGREVRFGIRLHTLSRDRSEEAWAVAERLLADLDPADVATAQAALASSESEGQKRMRALHGGAAPTDARALEVHPGLWSGIGLDPLRGGHRARRQPRRGRGPDRRVRRRRDRGVRAVGLPARRGGVLVRRGRRADPPAAWAAVILATFRTTCDGRPAPRPTIPGMTPVRRPARLAALAAASLLTLAVGCAPADDNDDQSAGSDKNTSCEKADLPLKKAGTLTIATDSPAYEPWFVDDDPTNGKGFESAVAYAIADQLGFSKDEVTWETVPFNASYQPGEKSFDFDINQVSITEERAKAVTFSEPYYKAAQAIVTLESSPYAKATSFDALKDAQFGAQVGTTSLTAIDQIAPAKQARVYDDTNQATKALEVGQIDVLVMDLPSAFYTTAAVLSKPGTIVGQFQPDTGQSEEFGLLMQKGSALASCLDQAIGELREDGTLADLEKEWLSQTTGVPELS